MASDALPRCEFEGKKLILKLNFTIPADPQAISPVVDGVMKLASEMKCAEGKELEMETALREALANAVIHGAHRDSGKEVQCCVACDENLRIMIVVRDPGEGFDPSAIPSPIIGQNVYESHGRGLYLINQLMDEVHFERGGTEIHMTKN